ncbi:MAG: hypothetical protein VXY81_13270, partial [Pseudomonadota bacterium]|nr:hypothetical protein [Pseudomonadota bacterium]
RLYWPARIDRCKSPWRRRLTAGRDYVSDAPTSTAMGGRRTRETPLSRELMSQPTPLRIFIGYDRREDTAYRVCAASLARRARRPVAITPLIQDSLRARGLYTRPVDPLASTEFTYTRFLTPYLAGFEGWALFCDCDFLWLDDVGALFDLADPQYAVMCVHHDHRPRETIKMDGAQQTVYPRKNWSSLMLFNCGHTANAVLTPALVNHESGAFLHRLQWLDDDVIGAVPETWNWLEGWSPKPAEGTPKAVHYTRGGPWFENWRDVDYADLWQREAAELDRD